MENTLQHSTIAGLGIILEEVQAKLVKSVVKKDSELLIKSQIEMAGVAEEIERRSATCDQLTLLKLTQLKAVADTLKGLIAEFASTEVFANSIEKLSEVKHSLCILQVLRNSYNGLDLEDLIEVCISTNEDIEEDTVLNSCGQLEDLGFIGYSEENLYILSEKGNNLFETYGAYKQYTNRYERLKRVQNDTVSNSVNAELLEKIGSIDKGFALLENLKNHPALADNAIDLADVLASNVEYIEEVLAKLIAFGLVLDKGDDCYKISKKGVNVFTLYKKSKQYTNKYEVVRRKDLLKLA